ncbi:MAG: thioredoxin domain-containing protein [Alphaproteobacteria bacterium]|nr:thioredoxin domain-containing protein [Alphaproteobacteria bacterium]
MTDSKGFLVVIVAAAAMVLAVFGALRYGGHGSDAAATGGTASRAEMEKVVHDYLLKNPSIIVEAMQKLQDDQSKREIDAIREGVKNNATELFHEPDPIIAGNPDGDVTMVEFFDYHCPYCKKVRDELVKLLNDDGKIRLVLKEFPILTPESEVAARAAIAAHAQGKYWPFHLALLGSDDLSDAAIFSIAKQVGLDVDRLKRDMLDPKVQKRLERNMKLADAMEVKATPTFIIGTEPASGAYPVEKLKELVAAARKKQQASNESRER